MSCYALDVARAEFYGNMLQYDHAPQYHDYLQTNYFHYDECSFERAKIIGFESAKDVTGMVLADIEAMGMTKAVELYETIEAEAFANFKQYTNVRPFKYCK